jgi:hypothetical protein
MAFIKNPIRILAECAESESANNTEYAVKEANILERYKKFAESAEDVKITANMVPAVKVGDKYYTEMNLLLPFMRDNGIKSISKALDEMAEANGLEKYGVGLLMESAGEIEDLIKKACDSTGDIAGQVAAKSAAVVDITKAVNVGEKLEAAGYSVLRKKSVNEKADQLMARKVGTNECDGSSCGNSKEECGDSSCGDKDKE